MKEQNDPRVKAVSRRLKAIRKAKFNCSYEVFAYDNQINRTQVYRLESEDSCNPKLTSLLKVLDALDVSLSEFFDTEEFKVKQPKE